MINVTKTFTPPLEEYISYLENSYKKRWLTNRGSTVIALEQRLKTYLNVENLTLTTNGTLPIQIAIKSLELKGEIITTPFSYVATTSSIVWENCTPVFADIEPDYLTIDPRKIEEKISNKTSAILATHVFGNPCDVEAIEEIAQKYNLKIIYDAAHCFGVKYKGRSIFEYGDVSTCSFHATKIFHTGEGGCFIAKDKELHNKLYSQHNFGHKTSTSFERVGVNAKMSELQAAMGMAVFDHIDFIFEKRKNVVMLYDSLLKSFPEIQTIQIRPNTDWNYHYYPVILKSEKYLLDVVEKMNEKNIFPRRYFYPSLNKLDYVKYEEMLISESISRRILCLPLSTYLEENNISDIVNCF